MQKPATAVRLIGALLLAGTAAAQSQPGGVQRALYNTTKQKLLEGKQVFSFTQSKFDIKGYCEAAKHYDFAWFEMQHSTLEFRDVEAMIAACPYAGATPMVRLPDAQEWHIQHATDIGALGIVVPTVDDVDRAREAAKWAYYPPKGRRSSGQNQATRIWGINGINYRQTINDNMMVVVMIETPTGAANAFDIASVPGIDVVIIGNNDLSSFSGYSQDDPRYQAMVTKIHDDTIRAGKIFGQANAKYAKGHPLSSTAFFFQNGPSKDGWVPPSAAGGGRNPNAPPEGETEGLGHSQTQKR
ncbi:MAG TPA: aldolase/citrate lyase family protein [Bryobacteraceae bacterium]|nr:aldolase/citrate lyase family protein [Bryobacteraceae bacterium]